MIANAVTRRAGMMRSYGCVTYSATRNVWPSMNKRHVRYPFLSSLKDNEEKANKRQSKHKKKAYDLDRMLRKEIERKKSKVFRQQRHMAKKNMYYAREVPDGLDEGIIEGSLAYRKTTIENKVNKQQKVVLSPRDLDEADLKPGLQFVDAKKMKKRVPRLALAAAEVNANIDREMDEVDVPQQTILAKLLQSDFEEMEERRRFINLDRKRDELEAMLEKMYKQMSGAVEGEGGEGGGGGGT